MTQPEDRIGLGGGCHWCTEAVFQTLRGVRHVAQGFIQSSPPHDSWSEAVIVRFDPHDIDLATLIEVHLRTHASTSAHKLRGKYRSAIYVFNDAQKIQAGNVLQDLQREFDAPLQTMVLCHKAFKPSDTRFQNYYATDPERPFCQTYIDPKLRLLRERFSGNTKAAPPINETVRASTG
ncbi:MAG: peptide methionine sulfoxide reductase [Alphaproteobacteria bacterium]|nr:peptide methionine sulfoxide reductase [Alphaproteobacteria bacterium]